MNPFVVLGVAMTADDAVIRQAYLKGVQDYPPEMDGKRFQEISQAYERIKDRASRHRYHLLDNTLPGDGPVDALVNYARYRSQFDPLPFPAMKELLQAADASTVRPTSHAPK